MKIGIISDPHDNHANVLEAVRVFNEQEVEYVLHAGDMVSPFTAKAFGQLKGHLIAVLGNNEGEKLVLQSVMDNIGAELYPYAYKGEIAGKRIFMTHTEDYVDEAVGCGLYDLIVYGHTHKQDIRRQGDTLVINPGEATDWLTGQGHIVIVDLDDMSHQIVPIG